MGSGKTTIAPLVAARLGVDWHDTDDEVAAMAGRPVADLVAADEVGFRRLERARVAALAEADAVVACGGGVVLDPTTVALMRSTGVVVLLTASPATLVERVGGGQGRPLLAGEPAGSLAGIAAARRGLYEAAADVVVDGAGSPDEVAARVVEAWTSSS